jgi:very-short-patch-repair endonuclease
MARAVWAIARRDHDVISRWELLAIGFHPKAIDHRLKTGRLHQQARGVYLVGSPHLSPLGELMVTIKRCGEGAVLSHLSAAVHWELWRKPPPRPQVTVPGRRNPKPKGIEVHRRDRIVATRHERVPVTTVLQTLIDCSAHPKIERMVNQADARNLLRADRLRRQLDGLTDPGAPMLRELLDRDAFVLTDSELERLFVPIALRAGLGKPLTQQWVNGYRVDFYWPELELVVEVDGLRYHRTPLQQRHDLEREHTLRKAGIECCRFSYWQVARDARSVEAALATFRPARTPGRPRAA